MKCVVSLSFILFTFLFLASCSSSLSNITTEQSDFDLSGPNFKNESPVHLVLWSWISGNLVQSDAFHHSYDMPHWMGPPEKGEALLTALKHGQSPALATGYMNLKVDPKSNYELRIGAISGAHEVYVNGVLVLKSGTLPDEGTFQPIGHGGIVTVQPKNEYIEIVYRVASSSALVKHTEMNRIWQIAPMGALTAAERQERTGRVFQIAILLAAIAFMLLFFRHQPLRSPIWLMAFLGTCILKLLFNVEAPLPLSVDLFPSFNATILLFIEHGINMLPLPFFVLYLRSLFPKDVSKKFAFWIALGAGVVTLWEVFPFICLLCGQVTIYDQIMGTCWNLILNLYVALTIIFCLERLWVVMRKRLPMAVPLFFGSLALGVCVTLPILINLFYPVAFNYILGWALFIFIMLYIFFFARNQMLKEMEIESQNKVNQTYGAALKAFIPPQLPAWFGKMNLVDVLEDSQNQKTVFFISASSEGAIEKLSMLILPEDLQNKCSLIRYSNNKLCWAVTGWAEDALRVTLSFFQTYKNLTRKDINFAVLEYQGTVLIRKDQSRRLMDFSLVPEKELDSLLGWGKSFGCKILLDKSLAEGLVSGVWKHHRLAHPTLGVIEWFEGDDKSFQELKLSTETLMSEALGAYSRNDIELGTKKILEVLKINPLDSLARYWLTHKVSSSQKSSG